MVLTFIALGLGQSEKISLKAPKKSRKKKAAQRAKATQRTKELLNGQKPPNFRMRAKRIFTSSGSLPWGWWCSCSRQSQG
jgi:hypothetical protein